MEFTTFYFYNMRGWNVSFSTESPSDNKLAANELENK